MMNGERDEPGVKRGRSSPRALLLSTVALLLACSAFAQEPPPDYSKEKLLLLFAGEPKKEESAFDHETGLVSFKGFGTRFSFLYLPMMMPWSGSPASYRGLGQTFPDPFALTGTPLPYTARSWRDKRARSAELQRIERSERKKVRARLKVNTRQ